MARIALIGAGGTAGAPDDRQVCLSQLRAEDG